MNRNQRRTVAAMTRKATSLNRKAKAKDQQHAAADARAARVAKKVEASRKRGEARRAFKKKIGLEHGVNPRRVVLLGKHASGVPMFKIKKA